MSWGRPFVPVLVACALIPAVCGPALAQGEPVHAGDRVRISAASLADGRVTGTVVSVDGNGLSIVEATGRPARAFPLNALTRLEVSVARRSRVVPGALIGGGLGLAAGAAIGAAAGQSCEDEILCPGSTLGAGVVGAIGLAVGAGVGALIGLTSRTDVWEVVALPGRPRAGLSAGRRGLAIVVSLPLRR